MPVYAIFLFDLPLSELSIQDAFPESMSRIAKLTSRWLMNRGFTIGIDDVTRRFLQLLAGKMMQFGGRLRS